MPVGGLNYESNARLSPNWGRMMREKLRGGTR